MMIGDKNISTKLNDFILGGVPRLRTSFCFLSILAITACNSPNTTDSGGSTSGSSPGFAAVATNANASSYVSKLVLTATVYPSSVLLSYIPPLGQAGPFTYSVYRSVTGLNAYTKVAGQIFTQNYYDLTATNGVVYDYYAESRSGSGQITQSDIFTAKPIAAFQITSVSQDQAGNVTFNWTNAAGADAYSIVFGTGNGLYGGSIAQNVTSPAIISGIAPGATINYRILATNTEGIGAKIYSSNIAPSAVMTNFTLGLDTSVSGHLRLTWTTATGATNYRVVYGTTSGSYPNTASGSATSPFDIVGLSPLQNYYFQVIAEGGVLTHYAAAEQPVTYQIPVTYDWDFSAAQSVNYTYNNSTIDFLTGTSCQLSPMDQTDNDNSASGFGGGTFNGITYGALSDGSSFGLKLGPAGGCDGSVNACSPRYELSAFTSPGWPSLVGLWHLNETSGAIQNSSSFAVSNGSASSGSLIQNLPGKMGGSIGTNSGSTAGVYAVGAASTFNFVQNTGNFAMQVWFRTDLSSVVEQLLLSNTIGGGQNGFFLSYDALNKRIYGVVTSASGPNFGLVTTPNNFVADKNWHYIVYTGNGSNAYLYIDGVLINASTAYTPASYATGNSFGALGIGSYGATGTYGLIGSSIDEAAIWNRNLTASEISAIYARQSPSFTIPQMANLKGLWHLDEGAGTSGAGAVKDASGNSTNLTPVGGTTFASAGKYNTSVLFNGTTGNLQKTGFPDMTNYTLAAWVKGPASVSNWAGFVGASTSTNKRIEIGVDNLYHVYLCYGNLLYKTSTLTNLLSDTNWHHVAATFDGTTPLIYVDGVSVAMSGSAAAGVANSANLLVIGQMSFTGSYFWPGRIDEAAVWNTALSSIEINSLITNGAAISGTAQSGAPIRSGAFLSRVMDAGATNLSAAWTTLSWFSQLPYGKELPDSNPGPQSEGNATSQYNWLNTGNLMTNNKGLWHFNEASGTTGANSVLDTSGQNFHGTPTAGVTFGGVGKFNTAATFNGTTGQITMSNPVVLEAPYTVCAWVNPNSILPTYQMIATNGGLNAGQYGFSLYYSLGQVNWVVASNTGNSAAQVTIAAPNAGGSWVHYCGTWDGSLSANSVKLYMNGAIAGTQTPYTGAGAGATHFNLQIGNYSTYYWAGSIDEVGVWSSVLGAVDISQLYVRGVSRMKYQVRSCATSNCTDGNFMGPDGTSATYFTEAFNKAVQAPVPSGRVLSTPPKMTFANFTAAPANNRYFQYQAIFESDVSTITQLPELTSVVAGPIHYDSSGQTIVGSLGMQYNTVSSITETMGGTGCAGGVTYELGVGSSSASSAVWYWWDASANAGVGGWVPANGTMPQSNAMVTVNAHLSVFDTQVGTGKVFFKAFLHSSGATPCELTDVTANGYIY